MMIIKYIPGRTNKEYYDDNKDKLKEYRETNKGNLKEYREENKDLKKNVKNILKKK
jgi:hypothetical protein